METAQAELFDLGKQAHAEIEALRNLWMRVIPGCTPTMDTVSTWLAISGYVKVARAIHATERLNKKYEGRLKPSQLIQFVKQQLAKEETNTR
jgi:hypothetical protein